MVGSKFDLNGLCFDQLKQRERLCVLFCFPSLVMELGEKNVKSADSLSLLLDRQFMESSFIPQKPFRYIGNHHHVWWYARYLGTFFHYKIAAHTHCRDFV